MAYLLDVTAKMIARHMTAWETTTINISPSNILKIFVLEQCS